MVFIYKLYWVSLNADLKMYNKYLISNSDYKIICMKQRNSIGKVRE